MLLSVVKSNFTIFEVVVLTGFTKHMLEYLRREKIFLASQQDRTGRGISRLYTYEDVVWLRALNTICQGKGKIRHLKGSLSKFRAEFGPIAPGQRIEKCLFVLGDELCVRTGADGGRELRSGQMTLGFFVDLAEISQGVADCVIPIPNSSNFSLTEDALMAVQTEKEAHWEATQQARNRRAKREASTGRKRA